MFTLSSDKDEKINRFRVRFHSVIKHALNQLVSFVFCRFLLSRTPQEVPLSESLVLNELEAWKAHMTVMVGGGDSGVTREQQVGRTE